MTVDSIKMCYICRESSIGSHTTCEVYCIVVFLLPLFIIVPVSIHQD